MNQLHPGIKWQFRLGCYFLFAFLGVFFGIFIIFPVVAFLTAFFGGFGLLIGLFLVLGYIVFAFIFSEIITRMSYNRWLYEFTDDGLKLERGIIWKRYSNVPYERIQNVDIHRGILARMLGYSTVMIQTAGYSAYPSAEGTIPAVDANHAEQIRSFVMKKITRRK